MGIEGENSSLSAMPKSQGKFRLEWSKCNKYSSQLGNRVHILELEKMRKIKDIEKKLYWHRRHIETKLQKHQQQKYLESIHLNREQNISLHSLSIEHGKKFRQENMKSIRDQLARTKSKQFYKLKKEKEDNNRKIQQVKLQEKQENIQKRNRVRLMEIEAKENIVSSWNEKLKQMKQDRQKLMARKMKEHQHNLCQIAEMEKKEGRMLKQIMKTEHMEKQLHAIIEDENQMRGNQLAELYHTSSA